MYVVSNRGYMPVREQQLGPPHPMHTALNNEMDDKTFDRVHEWIAQQHKFTGLPPPDEESLFRSQSIADITSKDVSSIADSTTFTDWYTNPSEDEVCKFGGLEVNRYYSPNMTRRRGYIPRSDPSLSNAQYVVNGNRSNLPQLSTRQHNGDIRGSPVASSSRGSPVAWSPFNRYYYGSGEGNTFPRRNKINKDEKRNLFSSSIMDRPHQSMRPSYSDDPFSLRPSDDRLLSNRLGERIMASQYNTSQRSNSESFEQALDDEAIYSTETPPYTSNGIKFAVPQDVKKTVAEKNSGLIGNMSLDTQRLLTGNLPDVALTAAKAIHKRELSDSLPKYKGVIKSLFQHVRMSSAPERSPVNGPVNGHSTIGEDEIRLTYNKNCNSYGVRKVKAFSWPKRATLPSSKKLEDQDGLTKKNPTTKTESGYNTEKSEDKNDAPLVEDEHDKTIDTHSLSNDSVNSNRSLCKESVSSDKSLSNGSVTSDQSDQPPARPPLPSQKAYCEKKSPSKDKLLTSCDLPPAPGTSRYAQVSSTDFGLSTPDLRLSSSDLRLSSPDVRLSSPDVRPSSTDVPLRRSVATDHLSNISGPSCKTSDQCHQYTRIKYLRGRNSTTDCTVSAFCSSTTDLTRNVSMSLKDLIRIHEQEIARVSGARGTGTGSTRLKSNESMHEKLRKCSISESKARSKSVWKRHTTIGLLTHFNGVDKEKDILDFKTTDKLPISNFSTTNEVTTTSNVLFGEPADEDDIPPPYSPTSCPVKYTRKRNAPLTLPKPYRASLNSLVETGRPKISDTKTATTPLSPPVPDSLHKDACVQTDLVLFDLHESEAVETLLFAKEKRELETKFEKEKEMMQQKLEEQKKVANAYQKLEDRYRRKVYELQKALHMCTCSRGKTKLDTRHFAESSYSKCNVIPDNHDISVQKVDGILHQLEAWLNNQTNGMHTDTSELSSLIGSTDDTCSRYRVPQEHYTSPPLEIIDQIDATSV